MLNRACPICASLAESGILLAEANIDENRLDRYAFASRKLPEYMHYRLILCRYCDVIYASPVPPEDSFAKAYFEADYDSNEEAYLAGVTYGRLLKNIVQALPDLNGALDIGTGNGAFLEQLLDKGFSGVVGIEPSVAPIMAAKEKIRPLIRNGVFRVKDFDPGTFSLITCFQTLEHLFNPLAVVNNIYTLLKKRGAVLFVCHNHRAFSAKILGRKSPIFDIEHLQLFSPKSAERLLGNCGFKNIRVIPILNRYPLYYWLKLLPLPIRIKEKCLPIIKETAIGCFTLALPAGNIAIVGYK